jgi:AP-4 complex subunit epsilon-1
MTNPVNVEMITQKLVDHLATTSDFHLRAELVSRITQLAERFSPNNEWFIETMIRVFLLGGDLVRAEIAHNLMQLIAEGVEDEHGDEELRIYAVTKLMDVLEHEAVVPDVLVQLAVWVLSEYGYLSPTHALNQIADHLVMILEQAHQSAFSRRESSRRPYHRARRRL